MKRAVSVLGFLILLSLLSCTYAQSDSVGRFEYSIPIEMTEKPFSPAKGDSHKYYSSETDIIHLWVRSEIAWNESERILNAEDLLARVSRTDDQEIKTDFILRDGLLICIRVSLLNNTYISQLAATNGVFSIFFTFSSMKDLEHATLTELANSIVFK